VHPLEQIGASPALVFATSRTLTARFGDVLLFSAGAAPR
jgi:hypothetical protein